jgi:RNA methyltransferase, TrmH family
MATASHRYEVVTSARNPLLRDVRRALHRGELTPDGCCVAETFHLLEEALRSERPVRAVIAAASVQSAVERHIGGLRGVRLLVVDDPLLAEIGATETAQGVIALVEPPSWKLDHLLRGRTLLLVLDGVQDPGNAGAMLRSAEAFGATGVLTLKGSVSPFNAKTIRASAGSIFRMPLVAGMDPALARAALEQNRLDVYAAAPSGGLAPAEAKLTRRTALVFGSEAHGVSDRMRSIARDITIPTLAVESLNAAVAAGILLYEANRQRRLGREPV